MIKWWSKRIYFIARWFKYDKVNIQPLILIMDWTGIFRKQSFFFLHLKSRDEFWCSTLPSRDPIPTLCSETALESWLNLDQSLQGSFGVVLPRGFSPYPGFEPDWDFWYCCCCCCNVGGWLNQLPLLETFKNFFVNNLNFEQDICNAMVIGSILITSFFRS